MANALEHGQGLLSMAVGLDDGVLHVGVQDPTNNEQPKVLALNVLSRDWGTDAGGESGGKTVWFELSTPP